MIKDPDSQPQSGKRNLTTIIIVFVLAGVAVITTALLLIFNLNSSSGPNNSNDDGEDDVNSSYGISVAPPKITDFTAEAVTGDTFIFNVKTAEYDSSKYFLEYELTNQNRVQLDSEVVRADQFNIEIEPNDATTYRLKVRLTDKESTSEWSESNTLELDKDAGLNILEPAKAYHDTAWAQGEGGQDRFKEAMKVAYNITEITDITTYCMKLNSGSMQPGQLLPPMPATKPRTLTLSYTIQSIDYFDDSVSFTYFWCES